MDLITKHHSSFPTVPFLHSPIWDTRPKKMAVPMDSMVSPDEDWSKIQDRRQRRRIQNRIAQRRYREKLKKSGLQPNRGRPCQRASSPGVAAHEISQPTRESRWWSSIPSDMKPLLTSFGGEDKQESRAFLAIPVSYTSPYPPYPPYTSHSSAWVPSGLSQPTHHRAEQGSPLAHSPTSCCCQRVSGNSCYHMLDSWPTCYTEYDLIDSGEMGGEKEGKSLRGECTFLANFKTQTAT
ncbi:hypothetical protein F4821DRAFT_251449 [Hypoxylon rubiginosum]|uniref:Uncharacterized protein n=1 Tax=Hypoxylon rubiginosum TaxID=110542 RepID=A0ACC0CJA8_9PEZI|nr:hypothetical protein F4821DRAFT_251449 [Hypoxylon rubiginosum]